MAGWKQRALDAEARARELAKELEEAKAEAKAMKKERDRETIRAAQAVKLLQDGTEAGALRVELAKWKAEAAALAISLQRLQTPGQVQAELDAARKELEAVKAELAQGEEWKASYRAEIAAHAHTLELLKQVQEGKGTASTGGRPVKYGDDVAARVKEARAQGVPFRQIAKEIGASLSTVQRLLKQ